MKWGTTSQHVFKERNPYIYKVTIKSYMIKLWATDCVKCAKKGKLQGEYCSHNKKELMLKEIPLKYGNSVYGGSAAFAWEGQEAHFTEPVIQGYSRVAASDDRSGLHGTISVSNGTVSVNDTSRNKMSLPIHRDHLLQGLRSLLQARLQVRPRARQQIHPRVPRDHHPRIRRHRHLPSRSTTRSRTMSRKTPMRIYVQMRWIPWERL